MHDPDEPTQEISKSQRKRGAKSLQKLGEELVQLNRDQLDRLELPEDLRGAIDLAQKITKHGGHKRQLQYIGKLLRGMDAEPVQQGLDGLRLQNRAAAAQLHRIERWREHLLKEGDDALAEILQNFPHADRQYLRQLMRSAHQEFKANQPPRSSRALFRYLRELLENGD